MFVDRKCRYLIAHLDDDNQPRPDPQPQWNLKDWQKSYSATRNKTDVCHAVQYCTGLTLGMPSPRQVPIDHITDPAQAIDYPESRTCQITEQETGGPNESEDSYYVGNVFHFGWFTAKSLFQPAKVVPAWLHFAVVTGLDKFPKGLPGFLLTAVLPVMLDEVHPDSAVGLRK